MTENSGALPDPANFTMSLKNGVWTNAEMKCHLLGGWRVATLSDRQTVSVWVESEVSERLCNSKVKVSIRHVLNRVNKL